MSILASADIEMARGIAETSFDGTAVYGSGTTVSDGGGGYTTGFSAQGTVACKLSPYTHGSGEQVDAERLSPDSEYLFTFPAETPITHSATIVYQGGTFAVTAVRRRSVELTRRVEVKEVT